MTLRCEGDVRKTEPVAVWFLRSQSPNAARECEHFMLELILSHIILSYTFRASILTWWNPFMEARAFQNMVADE